ncbi:MAG: FecR domain-containing protein [Myxococcota bacterium]|nr:FecR domain-containing protein [Myxococcota bacterium]
MTNLERARDLVRKRVRVDWDEEYLELGAIRVGSRRSRRRRGLAVGLGLMACAAAVVVALASRGRSAGEPFGPSLVVAATPAPSAAPLGVGSEERPIRFHDGSMAFLSNERTRLSITDDTPSRVTAELVAGRSRFEVVPSPTRMFSVRAGAVTVIVIGTAFSVERKDDLVDVAVERGRVRVESPSGNQELSAGERASVPATSADPTSAPSLQPAQKSRTAASDRATWRTLAEQRRFQEAYRLLPESLPSIDTPRDLLLAADSARLSGHPEAAVKYLAALIRLYPKDFSAQLAAFSLGTVYLDQLNRPAEAALHFGEARALAGTGALSEDALGRELEALVRAGDTAQARGRAEEYVRLFPAGRHVELARKVTRID